MSDESTVVTVTGEDDSTVVTTVDHQESLRRVRNLALWFVLGGTVPTDSIWD